MSFSLDTPSYALIDGSLCKLNRRGSVVRRHPPMGRAIEVFLIHDDAIFVRESPEGLLGGISNLYCLDGDLLLRWLAQAPGEAEFFSGSLSFADGLVSCETTAGIRRVLGAHDGRLLPLETPTPEASTTASST